MTGNCNGSEEDLLHEHWGWGSFRLKILWQLIAFPQVVKIADALAGVTLPGVAQEDCVLLRDEPVLLALPLRVQVEITVQIREALAFDKKRKDLGSLVLQTRGGREVKELE